MYAAGRPLWQLSLCWQGRGGPLTLLRWSATRWRKMEALRDRVFFSIGSSEAVIPVEGEEKAMLKVTMQWRKPLSFGEITRMAPTAEVRARPGRP